MIDIIKYSKKNKFYHFIATKILRIDIHLFSKPLFLKYNVELNLTEDFFYDYKNKIPLTKWMTMKVSRCSKLPHPSITNVCLAESIFK